MGKIEKAPQAKISVIGTIFIPKIAKKTQKNDQQPPQQKIPPVGGTDFGFNLGIPPTGGISRDSPHRGDLPPPKTS